MFSGPYTIKVVSSFSNFQKKDARQLSLHPRVYSSSFFVSDSSSSSFTMPLVAFLNSLRVPPAALPISGSFAGPKINRSEERRVGKEWREIQSRLALVTKI